eukprot:6131578-Alexandrium_andersonii.AAC.1
MHALFMSDTQGALNQPTWAQTVPAVRKQVAHYVECHLNPRQRRWFGNGVRQTRLKRLGFGSQLACLRVRPEWSQRRWDRLRVEFLAFRPGFRPATREDYM